MAFALPIHPGDTPVHAHSATGPVNNENNQHFKRDHLFFQTASEELKQQVLAAVSTRYLSILEDANYGYFDVSILKMLTHLEVTYATNEPKEIESNHNALSTIAWNPDEPIEDLWSCIQKIQRFSIDASRAITDAAALCLTLVVFEKNGVFTTATEKWRNKP